MKLLKEITGSNRLIPLSEFVKIETSEGNWLKQARISGTDQIDGVLLQSIINYTDFITQKPELWMFVPCDKDGKPLEKPKEPSENCVSNWMFDIYRRDCLIYEEAEKRVIFEGWEISPRNLAIINKEQRILIAMLEKTRKNVS